MKTAVRNLGLLSVFLAVGCGASRPPPRSVTTSEVAYESSEDPSCPVAIPGTLVQVADVRGGVALFFTNESGDVRALRERVRRLAEHYQQSPVTVAPTPTRMDPGLVGVAVTSRPSAGHDMPDVEAVVEHLPQGADIILTPRNPFLRETLRRIAREEARHMAQGVCPPA